LEYFTQENYAGFVVSFLAGMAVVLTTTIFSGLKKTYRFIRAKPEFLDGHWIAAFPGSKGGTIFEIIKIKTLSNFINIEYQSYKFINDKLMNARIGSGRGEIRAGVISCSYVRKEIFSGVIGSYLFKQVLFKDKICLSGYSVQRSDEGGQGYFDYGSLAFIRVNIPFYKRITTLFQPLFSSPDSLKRYLRGELKNIVNMSIELRATIPDMPQEQANKKIQLTSFVGS
jgi:hypothetical protein